MSSKDGPEPPVDSASIVLLALARRIEVELNAELQPLDLTVTRLGLLGHIAGLPGVSFSELARVSGTSVQSVHSAVKGLVRAGRSAVGEVDERLFGPEPEPALRRIGEAVRNPPRSGSGDRSPGG